MSTTTAPTSTVTASSSHLPESKSTGAQTIGSAPDVFNSMATLQASSWPASLQAWQLEPFDTMMPDAQQFSNAPFPRMSLPASDDLLYANPLLTSLTSQRLPTSSGGSSQTSSHATLTQSANLSRASDGSPAASSATSDDSRSPSSILAVYTSHLLREDFMTPLLHWSLYGDRNPDINVLPRTSMALACGRGVQLNDSFRFMQRAMDAERHRLIDDFPQYQCLMQWDALHAMLLYELIDLRDNSPRGAAAWKHVSRTPRLRVHFLLKMAKCYRSAYAELTNPSYGIFSSPASTPLSDAQSAWERWRITETARRTLFLINIINWYGNFDDAKGKPTPYYEALDDDLIFSMPLPCAHKVWVAEDEEQWKMAVQTQDRRPSDGTTTAYLVPPGQTLRDVLALYVSDGLLSHKLTRDELLLHLGDAVGFDDSDQYRNLIVLCAYDQFT